ncbi:N-acetylmuramoyl-L-alanine amidase [Halobacillus sp. B29]|uniref:N-acetylmuramoyl-L-alanine amidase n=1 Tax=Halobacillus sp. B29 TaxID=3457432 RepID=UPI003FCD0141
MKTVVIDPGHGGSDLGATYQGNQEKTFNLMIALNVRSILSQNYEVDVVMTRTTDVTLSLTARTQLANQISADYFLSIHNNAAGGSGFESCIYNGPLAPDTRAYQNIIQNSTFNAISKYNVRNRGQKRENFRVLRETDMSALLLEVLCVDNPNDLALLKSSAFINDVSRGIATGVADALNLPEKSQPTPTPGELYRVIAGSFQKRENADQRVEDLAQEGIASFVVPAMVSGAMYYRVQAGAYSNEDNAKEQVERLQRVGITDAFIIKGVEAPMPEPEPPADPLYRVIAGSFRNRENAEEHVEALADEGINSFIVPTTISDVLYYRVQAGAFAEEENALELVQRLRQIGIADAFIIRGETSDPDPQLEPEDGYTILGDMYLNACQLNDFVKTVNPDAPNLVGYYIKYGEAYGIRGDTAYAQAISETNYFRFTGLVSPEQNNYAGIGATGPGNPGATFSTPEEGVHAHIQHLYAYASTEQIPTGFKKVDPRFDLVTRGSATTWVGLNGKWAVPGDTYGQQILALHERNINYTLAEMNKQLELLSGVLKELE